MVTMLKVFFPPEVADEKIRFAVIVTKSSGKWLFVRHQARTTLECPGGHREAGETPEQAARRELWEETGAVDYHLTLIGAYGVKEDNEEQEAPESFGMLYRADVYSLGEIPKGSEIAETVLLDTLPENWTYPQIQPILLAKAWSGLVEHSYTKQATEGEAR